MWCSSSFYSQVKHHPLGMRHHSCKFCICSKYDPVCSPGCFRSGSPMDTLQSSLSSQWGSHTLLSNAGLLGLGYFSVKLSLIPVFSCAPWMFLGWGSLLVEFRCPLGSENLTLLWRRSYAQLGSAPFPSLLVLWVRLEKNN